MFHYTYVAISNLVVCICQQGVQTGTFPPVSCVKVPPAFPFVIVWIPKRLASPTLDDYLAFKLLI